MQRTKPQIAVIYGGISNEHEISCISARNVIAAIDTEKYDVVNVGITKSGAWFLQDDIKESLTNASLPEVQAVGTPVTLSLNRNFKGLVSLTGESQLIELDAIFPILHGRFGEDGTIQGAAEFVGLACVGAGTLASALAMDKSQFKLILKASGLPSVPSVSFTITDWNDDPEACLATCKALQFPLFVKPARAGSSLGVEKVETFEQLQKAVKTAFGIDEIVLVEQAVTHSREIECGVLVENGIARASVPSEIKVKGNFDFYSYEAKYVDDSTELIVPAELELKTVAEVQKLALETFRAIGAKGYARVDFLITEDGAIFINELNTIPGFTNISMFPRMFAASGVSYPALIDTLISDALNRHG
ncbi:MAG: hypothetical protein RIS09_864 [Actinomycetota bacterium]